MHSSRVLSLCALVALSLSAGCSGCDPKKPDPIPPGATCSDSVKNGTETGVDCGGATCIAEGKTCADGVGCGVSSDCVNGFCIPTSHLCATPTCSDTYQNGAETGVDCGGATCDGLGKTCAAGTGCALDADCNAGLFCNTTTHLCTAPSCTDTFKNGTETDVDCGGSCVGSDGKTCALGLSCAIDADCASGSCDAITKVCVTPCTPSGTDCPTGGGACCSGFCDTTQTPDKCAEPCKDNGSSCTTGTDCCTGLCQGTPLACTKPATCTDNGLACPTAPGVCCSGYCNGTTCANPCTGNGNGCAFNSDCCTNYCDPTKLCANAPICKDDGASCTLDNNCCSNYCKPDTHQCAQPVSACKNGGAACTDDGDCCSSDCNNPTKGTLAGTCTTTLFCKTPGAACVNSGECCSGTCTGGICSDTICKQSGTACSAATECCTGSCATTCQTLPAPTGTAACKTLYDRCTLNTDCCSTNCQDGKCTPAYTCHAASDLCYRPQDCCSGMCTAPATQTSPPTPGRCLPPSGGCNQDGNPCAGASNCCTRICSDLGSGATVCKPAGGCRMTGDFCDRTAACCGGSDPTSPGTVQSPYGVYCDGPATVAGPTEWDPSSKNDRTCTGGQACNPPGNICGGSGATNASQNCCNGKKEVCKQDSGGIWRCFGGQTGNCPTGWDANNPDCCIATGTTANPGGVCQFRDQCCNGAPCVPDASGVLRCTVPSCTAVGGTCEGGDDTSCCAGTVCTFDDVHGTFSCQVPTFCTSNAGACTVASDCCSNNCVNGRCAPPCTSANGSCTYDSDCCAGLACDIPAGATSGTCKSTSTCAPSGGSCVADADCCNAPTEACIEGSCAVPASCGSQYQACTTGADCCSPLNCVEPDGRACQSATGCSCDQCIYSGQACTQGATPGCCFGLTCTSGGTCQQCGGVSATCGGTGDCCSGLVCTNPMGQECNTPGCGVCDSCIVDGQACTASGGLYCCGSASCVSDPGTLSPCAPEDPTCGCIATGG